MDPPYGAAAALQKPRGNGEPQSRIAHVPSLCDAWLPRTVRAYAPAMSERRQLIIDCDTGTDDAVALMLAALHPALDLIGVTTVFGNAPLEATTINSISTLDLVGRGEIPVHAGLARPIVRSAFPSQRRFTADSADDPHGTWLPIERSDRPAASAKAVEWLIETYRAATQPITLMPIGPLSNIAAAVALEPKFAEWVPQLIIMGGGHEVGNETPSAEFNIWADPEAAASVFAAGFRDVLLVPLDATHKALVTRADCTALEALGTPAGIGAAACIQKRVAGYEYSQKMVVPESAPVHDALCVAALVEPSIVTTRRHHVAVEVSGELTVGRTVIDTHGRGRKGPNAAIAFNADARRFVAMLLETFAAK